MGERTPTGLCEAMRDAKLNAIRSIRTKEFEKLLSVADPAHGDEFLNEVCSCFLFFL